MKLSDLSSSQLYIIQGNYSTDTVSDLPKIVSWINWKDKTLLKDQVIIGKTFQNLVSNLELHKIIDPSVVYTLDNISKTVTLTQTYMQELPEALKSFRKFDGFYDFLHLYSERAKLEQELSWAYYLEAQSKTNVGMKRIQRLDDEIIELRKRKRITEPQYEFLEKNENQYKESHKSLNNEIKRVNKTYISKTTQINKLKRQIDVEKPKSDLYLEKIEELTAKLPATKLSDDKDYMRISTKLKTANDAINLYNQEIFLISEDVNYDKNHLKDLKNKLRELKQTHSKTGSNFTEIQNSYMEIVTRLKNTEAEKEELIKSQTKTNTAKDMGVPPSNIRFSSIIEEELKSNTIQISQYINVSETNTNEYIAQLLHSLTLTKSTLSHLTFKIDLLSENSLRQFQIFLESIQTSLNSVLHQIGLKISFGKLPLIEKMGNSIPQYGVQFELRKNQKSINFENLPAEEKLYVMCSFEYVLNSLSGIQTHVFADIDFKIKRTKSLFEKTIRLIKKGILQKNTQDKIVILISKPILEETIQKDMVITTLNS